MRRKIIPTLSLFLFGLNLDTAAQLLRIQAVNYNVSSDSSMRFAPRKLIVRGTNFSGKNSVISLDKAPLASAFPTDYYTRDFGFFCKKELQLEKISGVPLRFRLGSLESCNKIEGKQ